MNGYCKDCDFWKPLEFKLIYFPSRAIPTTQGNCSCEKFVYDREELPEEACDLLLYRDDDNYAASFTTCSHFGCIHFKARP